MKCNIDQNSLSIELITWWSGNKRIFPWRTTNDPYKILISEVLLHRTKANQVVPIYLQFIDRFPTIASLSSAPFEQIDSLLKNLGLNWRAKLLYKMAQEIVTCYNGTIPEEKNELESLPGISNYITAAVRNFAFNIADPLLDTNTVRILGRVFGFAVTDSSRRSPQFVYLYNSLKPREAYRDFGYALLDLGALICTPRQPKCELCPLNKSCLFGLSKLGDKHERKAYC